MNKSTRMKLNLCLTVLIIALVLLAAAGLVLNFTGYRYIKADNGAKFFGKTTDGVILRGTIMLPDGTKAKIDRSLGTITYANGDVYDGNFSGFYRNGTGKMIYAIRMREALPTTLCRAAAFI